jgi:hypothetical protein
MDVTGWLFAHSVMMAPYSLPSLARAGEGGSATALMVTQVVKALHFKKQVEEAQAGGLGGHWCVHQRLGFLALSQQGQVDPVE